ncbi:extracellular solute-binding protein [Paenibacillus sp. SAF-054]|uniref:extracellular solute-binding protein n=1 Tax=unclassified Paenibacillus TaxID=185978 RepID=UPI003F803C43
MKTASRWKKATILLITAMLIFVFGCSNNGDTEAKSGNNQASKKLEKIRVSIWDRGNAPEGAKITDTILTKWINEQVASIGLEVEFVPLPRAEESAKLSTWMASGNAPDVILTYSVETFLKFASQGGLAELDESVEKYGQDIMVNNKLAMESAGTYDGKRYAVMSNRPSVGGSTMKIRADWLEKVGMDVPTTIDELYEVLKAFKEKNPGGVNQVIPYSIPSFDNMVHFGLSLGAGIDMAGPGTTLYMASGNIVDGHFVSQIALPEGREYFKFLHKLYKEGLLPKEFITDINGQQHTENVTSGLVGFLEDNNSVVGLEEKMKEVKGADWEVVPPFIAPDGKQQFNAGYPFGMFIMVPKTSEKKADAVVKYLNWMSNETVLTTLLNGFEGEHYSLKDGIRMPIDLDKNSKEINWYSADITIMSLGLKPYTPDQVKIQFADKGENFIKDVLEEREVKEKYAVYQPLFTNDRPWTKKNVTTMDTMLLQELSNVIIANDFDKAYDNMLGRWKQMGGETYDKEVTEGLKANGVIQ